MKSMLIISGAFGLFKRKRVLEVGGYLTSSGHYHKDTVGEDMEIVVRLHRHMKEKKMPYNINYINNANCWTEVPENWSTLFQQRDRWQRGLIDNITFHSKMIFNKRYGSIGLLAFPYYLLFEIIGPFVEFQGYCMFFLAIAFGILNAHIALLLFISVILMGILVSTSSLIIGLRNIQALSIKNVFLLMLYSILENFGIRQWISFWRITGFFNAMRKPKGWGKMIRKGF